MDYLSYDLRLGEWDPRAQTGVAEVLQSPAGEGARYPFRIDLDIDAVAGLTSMSPSLAVRLGRKLAVSIFSQQSLTLWYESYQVARERHRGLRLRLHVDSWELSRLPWELLYDARRGDFLVFDPLVSVVRYIRLYSPPPSLRHGSRLKVLVVSASPRTEAQLDWRREFDVLREAVSELSVEGQVDLVFCEHATHDRLHRVLSEQAPDVVHYVGHGGYDRRASTGVLLLESDDGDVAPLTAQDGARLLRRYGVNLVVLNACETAKGAWAGLAPALVRREIPAVVAMQWPVEDRAAIRFSGHFYRALAQGRTIDECVAEGRMGASAGGSDPLAWAATVLFLRSVSGRLWSAPGSGDVSDAVAHIAPPAGEAASESGEPGSYFKTRGPLTAATDAELIIDRPELRRALRLAQQPSITQYVAVLSARQMGKTTLLFRLMDLVREHYPCAFVDLSVLRAQAPEGCFRFVAGRLLAELQPVLAGWRPPGGAEAVSDAVGFAEFLLRLGAATPASRIVVLLDEVGALSPESSDRFFNTLRNVFVQGRGTRAELAKFLFVFSGAVDLYGLTYGSNSPLNICEKIYLQDLGPADVARLVRLFRKLGVTVPDAAPKQIYELTGGHPYLTMRMCALLEHSGARRLSREQIEAAAEVILVEDDNIHHLIRQLDQRPLERGRLRSILLGQEAVPFSRNDPVLAALEMIGAVRPTQPAQVRNLLYERALRPYLERTDARAEGQAARPPAGGRDPYANLEKLRRAALGGDGRYTHGEAWQAFAAALFGLVGALTAYANVQTDAGPLGTILAVDGGAPGGGYWKAFGPAVLVEPVDVRGATPGRIVAEALGKAEAHDIRLVILVTSLGSGAAARRERLCGARGERCLIALDDAEIAATIAERGDLDALLRRKVLEARLRRV